MACTRVIRRGVRGVLAAVVGAGMFAGSTAHAQTGGGGDYWWCGMACYPDTTCCSGPTSMPGFLLDASDVIAIVNVVCAGKTGQDLEDCQDSVVRTLRGTGLSDSVITELYNQSNWNRTIPDDIDIDPNDVDPDDEPEIEIDSDTDGEKKKKKGGGGNGGGGGDGGGGGGGGDGGGGDSGSDGGGGDGDGNGDGDGKPTNPGEAIDSKQPETGCPVVIATGDKIQRDRDFVVSLPGQDFEFWREYSSSPMYSGSDIIGHDWMSPTFKRIAGNGRDYDSTTDPTNLILYNEVKQKHHFEKNTSTGRYEVSGSGEGYFTFATISSVTESQDPPLGLWDGAQVLRLVYPGQRYTDFYDVSYVDYVNGGSHALPEYLVGKVAREIDQAGNLWAYSYRRFDSDTSDSDPGTARVSSIKCYAADDYVNPVVIIWFSWISGTGFEDIEGKLDRVWVTRSAGNGDYTLTEEVRYIYRGLEYVDNSDLEPAFASTYTNSGVGENYGSLIQVIKRARIDPSASGGNGFRTFITQYRYHDQYESEDDGSAPLKVKGLLDQLKLIIRPEQIEHYAIESGQQVDEAAIDILEAEDDESLPSGGGLRPIDLASKVLSYETETGSDLGKVRVQFVQADCECSVASTKVKRTYEYSSYDISTFPQVEGRTLKIQHFDTTGSPTLYRTYFHDVRMATPYLAIKVTDAIRDESDDRIWANHYTYDSSNNVTEIYSEESMEGGYTPIDVALGGKPEATPSTSSGRVEAFTYDAKSRVLTRSVKEGDQGTEHLVERITYATTSQWMEHLPETIERFRSETDTTSADAIEVETRSYTFYTDFLVTNAKAKASTHSVIERETPSENGPTTTESVNLITLYNQYGQIEWERMPDGAVTYHAYDDFGNRLRLVDHADPDNDTGSSGSPELDLTDYGSPGTGITWGITGADELVWKWEYDQRGDSYSEESPSGVKILTRRQLIPPTVTYPTKRYVVTTFPHEIGASATPRFSGPAVRRWLTPDNRVLHESHYELDVSGAYTPLTGPLPFSIYDEVARTVTEYAVGGNPIHTRTWLDLEKDRHADSYIRYDWLGRVSELVGADETLTAFEYDVRDRVISTSVGRDDLTAGPQIVSETFYDHELDMGEPVQGVGNGNATFIRVYTGEPTGTGSLGPETRDTIKTFDYRDRLITQQNPDSPHAAFAYDNLGRVTEAATFESVPTGIATPLVDRLSYSRTNYSQRGLPYLIEQAIDPTNASTGYLVTSTWRDVAGRAVADWAPGSAGMKRVYDANGRLDTVYQTDRGGDGDPGSGSYEDAITLTGDTVIEQTGYDYDASGEPVLISRYMLLHDQAGYTAGDELDSSNAVVSYNGMVYDGARRVIASVKFGSNARDGSSDLYEELRAGGVAPGDTGAGEPAWPPSSPPTWQTSTSDWSPTFYNDYVTSTTTYDEIGRVQSVRATDGVQTSFFYNDRGDQIAVVENDTGIAAPTWNATSERWVFTSVGDTTNRTSSMVYDGAGNVVKRVAHKPDGSGGEEVQITEYDYVVEADSNPDGNKISSGSLLAAVRYPDPSTGEAGTTLALTKSFTYNRLGETRVITDQNETVHRFTRDDAGRVTLDSAELVSGSDLDDAVLAIRTVYDDAGRTIAVESLDDQSAVVNGIGYAYDTMGQLTHLYQNPTGAAVDSGGTPQTGAASFIMGYDTVEIGASGPAVTNYSRLSQVTYPLDSESPDPTVGRSYGTAGGLNDRIGRLQTITMRQDDSESVSEFPDVVNYEYLGARIPVFVEYDQLSLGWDASLMPDGKRRNAGYSTGTAGVYPGFDRFGRPRLWSWADNALTDAGSSIYPTRPPVFQELLEHDIAGVQLARSDVRPGSGLPERHEAFLHDDLRRLTEAHRGVWDDPFDLDRDHSTTGTDWTPGDGSTQWSLDALGNWAFTVDDTNEDGQFVVSPDHKRTRQHNKANELTQVGSSMHQRSYDDAGNLVQTDRTFQEYDYTYDAWNRLVKIVHTYSTGGLGGGGPQVETVYEAELYGTGWRSEIRLALENGTLGLDEQRRLYYSPTWQLVVEDIDEAWSSGHTTNAIRQYLWGTRGLDDIILQRRDANLDDTFGASEQYFHIKDSLGSTRATIWMSLNMAIERVNYNPFGEARHSWIGDIDGDHDVDSTDVASYPGTGVSYAIGHANYRVEGDVDRNGVWDVNDTAYANFFSNSAYGMNAAEPNGSVSGFSNNTNEIGYAGYIFISPSLLYHVRNRDYQPEDGRWLQRDPAGYIDGLNMYRYSRNNPLIATDPTGLEPGTGNQFLAGFGYTPQSYNALLHNYKPKPPTKLQLYQGAHRELLNSHGLESRGHGLQLDPTPRVQVGDVVLDAHLSGRLGDQIQKIKPVQKFINTAGTVGAERALTTAAKTTIGSVAGGVVGISSSALDGERDAMVLAGHGLQGFGAGLLGTTVGIVTTPWLGFAVDAAVSVAAKDLELAVTQVLLSDIESRIHALSFPTYRPYQSEFGALMKNPDGTPIDYNDYLDQLLRGCD